MIITITKRLILIHLSFSVIFILISKYLKLIWEHGYEHTNAHLHKWIKTSSSNPHANTDALNVSIYNLGTEKILTKNELQARFSFFFNYI